MRVVRQGSDDPLRYRLMVDFQEPTITGIPTATLYSPGGGEITGASPAVSVAGSEVTVKDTWSATLYFVDSGYQLKLEIVVAGETHARMVIFAVAPRGFESEVRDQDIFDEHPQLQTEAPASGLLAWRRAAWEEIASEAAPQLGDTPIWRVMEPSVFKRAHVFATLWLFYAANAKDSGPESEDWQKRHYYEGLYRESLDRAFQRLTVDTDEDNLVDEGELEQPWAVRWTP